MPNECILVVEDDSLVSKMLASALRRQGYRVVAASNASDGLVALESKEQPPDLMILDLNLSNDPILAGLSDGFNLLHWFRSFEGSRNLPVIIYTSNTSPKVEREAAECGVFSVVRKGEPASKLLEMVRSTLEQRKTT